MRYNYYSHISKTIFGLMLALPLVTAAQTEKTEKITYERPSYWRPYDQTGINVFETSKKEYPVKFEALRIRFGAGFTQQFQNLKHKNPDALNSQSTTWATSNKLYPVKPGFMTAQANLFMDVELADGISLNVTTYLSARHHNEAWVKGGYIQFDKLPFKGPFWTNLMKMATIKIGHMEINYGDAHFRRSDGGQALYNPFMESNIMDAYATEIGGEVYLKKNGLFGMIGISNGMIKGNIDSAAKGVAGGEIVDDNQKRSPSIYLKGGIDKQLTEAIRIRVSGSFYHNGSAAGSGLTLYGGDRTGSNYQNVMEKWKDAAGNVAASTAIAFSGRVNPGFSKKVNALMLNGFLKVKGLELFGTYENAKGRTKTEVNERKAKQLALDGVYRFGKDEKTFLGVRYNIASMRLANTAAITYTDDVKVDRTAIAGGWFLTKNILLKAEYVMQKYRDFPVQDYRSSGQFKGYVVEAVVGF
jgi:hypothetical protein